ncbi:hypothetical protein CFP65_7021 [Kitasatospora sp. MMS16-BH015]|uniref:hypothetical protein n=1 Tax=Kitasatospora sp. MMS16-BH015 TaxID=2018025 RepID=UPI000CA16499|nr:hypothetical protein [Kitasatospora sp. MMS16-BH015]AUG81628.1 hypothetical protein CFP65_7021 [Kitasatospora sp. MMS16-BH015]
MTAPTVDPAALPPAAVPATAQPATALPPADLLRFALRQGPLRGLLHAPINVDERIATTACLPPPLARGDFGRPLPAGAHELLAATPYPAGRVAADRLPGPQRLGAVLAATFGPLRREPSNPANDHRVTASVRSKFPVHVFAVPPTGPAGYLDTYRHALVDLDPAGADPATLRPAEAEDLVVVLAGRHTDLPTPYGVLRCALADLEVGINLRSLLATAELFDLRTSVRVSGPEVADAARLVAATGPGSWSAPVVVTLHGVGPLPPAVRLEPAGGGALDAELDGLLRVESTHPSLLETAAVTAIRLAAPTTPAGSGQALPEFSGPARLPRTPGGSAAEDWARVWWNRSAGRVPSPLSGFSARPVTLGEDCLRDLLGWAAGPAPTAALREVGARVRLTAVTQRLAGLPTGRYAVEDGALRLAEEDPELPRRFEEIFGYPLSPTNDCGVRHASALWVFSVDLPALVAELGPAAWGLLQVWCGWVSHGLTLGAAAHGLFARPARSFDEHQLADLLALPEEESPVFLTVCGRTRYAEPMLDLRP